MTNGPPPSTAPRRTTAAATRANETPEIRPEAVERGRALLESGRLGGDSGRLADALIDSLIDKG